MAVAKTTTKRNCKYTHTNIEKGKTRLVKKEKSENGKSNENLRVSTPSHFIREIAASAENGNATEAESPASNGEAGKR